jgi:hypothetical protein
VNRSGSSIDRIVGAEGVEGLQSPDELGETANEWVVGFAMISLMVASLIVRFIRSTCPIPRGQPV